MKRQEAITCLREINTFCRELAPDLVALVFSGPNDELSTGYQVHIHAALDKEMEHQIGRIVAKYDLAMHHEQRKIIIYKSKPVFPVIP
jgi:hypothetical protein